jgi:hypothetical protein
MKKIILLLFLFLNGCAFNVKTPVVANYGNLDLIQKHSKKNDVLVLLGGPQGNGVYGKSGSLNELDFYHGLAGRFSTSSANMDSGTAFISYKGDSILDLFYFGSKITGSEIKFEKPINIKLISDSVQIGSSSYSDLIKAVGEPDYIGKRINSATNINHSVAFWDASIVAADGVLREKFLFVGYDNNNIVQDLIWVSSDAEDIKSFGTINDQQMKHLYRNDQAGWGFSVMDPVGLTTGTKLDPIQVDALIRSNPKNVNDVIKIIGKPNALGIKSFKGSNSMRLSNWAYSKVDVKGNEANFIPSNASEEQRAKLNDSNWIVMSIEQTRLMIGHNENGDIQEILWTHPIK